MVRAAGHPAHCCMHYLFKNLMACGTNDNLDLFLVNRGVGPKSSARWRQFK